MYRADTILLKEFQILQISESFLEFSLGKTNVIHKASVVFREGENLFRGARRSLNSLGVMEDKMEEQQEGRTDAL